MIIERKCESCGADCIILLNERKLELSAQIGQEEQPIIWQCRKCDMPHEIYIETETYSPN
ncbi:hypothetical protein ACFLTS_03755 [Chloroflexota bacterium]